MLKTIYDQAIVPALVTLAGTLSLFIGNEIIKVLRVLANKFHVQLTAADEARVQAATDKLTYAVEERAARALEQGVVTTGQQKFDAVMGTLKTQFTNYTENALADHISASVFRQGLGAAADPKPPGSAAVNPPAPAVAPTPNLPPPVRSGEGGSTTMLTMLIVGVVGLLLAAAVAGCTCIPQKGKIDGEACAYQGLTVLDTVVGVVARTSRTELRKCGDEGKALRAAAQDLRAKGDQAGYEAELQKAVDKDGDCSQKADVVGRVLVGAEDSTQSVADGIPAAVAAGNKDFAGVLQPAFKAIKDLVKEIADQGVAIPAQVTKILGGA